MTDRELELQLRSWFHAAVPASETAPADLRASVVAIPRTVRRALVPFESRRRIALLAVAALLSIAIVGLGMTSIGDPSATPGPSASPAATSAGTSAAPASWEPVGRMVQRRRSGFLDTGNWATSLADGRVLVAGGIDLASDLPSASAQIFDPATGTWMATGSMVTARSGHTLTLLADGRVLAAGGSADNDASHALTSAELFDPTTGSWSPTGSMTSARTKHIAARLLDGRVLVAGGEAASAELYDPATGRWTETGAMHDQRWLFAATRLNDGRVLVEGTGHLMGMSSAELFDPATGTWATTTPMAAERGNQRSVLLDDGRVLVIGGLHHREPSERRIGPEIYDPATAQWSESGDADLVGGASAAVVVADGVVLATAGSSAYLFDPTSDVWTATASPPLVFDTLIAVGPGRVVAFGAPPNTYDEDPGATFIFDLGGQP